MKRTRIECWKMKNGMVLETMTSGKLEDDGDEVSTCSAFIGHRVTQPFHLNTAYHSVTVKEIYKILRYNTYYTRILYLNCTGYHRVLYSEDIIFNRINEHTFPIYHVLSFYYFLIFQNPLVFRVATTHHPIPPLNFPPHSSKEMVPEALLKLQYNHKL